MQIRRTGKGCLSYLLESKEEVIVIDASLDATIYSTIAKKKNCKSNMLLIHTFMLITFQEGRN